MNMRVRPKVPKNVQIDVLTEAGYRCAVPTCRMVLAIDLHHIVPVSERGGNELANLIALCPTCHRLHHCGEISRDSLYSYKAMLVSLSQAFDKEAIDNLLFLGMPESQGLRISGDGVLKFLNLIAARLASFQIERQSPYLDYSVRLTPRGLAVVDGWRRGDRNAVEKALSGIALTGNRAVPAAEKRDGLPRGRRR